MRLWDRLAARARWSVVGLAAIVLSGTIVDRTTGQPLTAVDVGARAAGTGSADGGKLTAARTNAAGHYSLRGLTPGHYTLTVSSDDVPPQTFDVVIGTKSPQQFNITACSTTLDYSCAAALP